MVFQHLHAGAVMAVTVFLTSCLTNDPQKLGEAVDEELYEDITYDSKVADRPGLMLDKKVKVEGKVRQIVHPGVYRVDMDGIQGFDDIYVIDQTKSAVPVKKGDYVEVYGIMGSVAHGKVTTEYEDELLKEIDVDLENEPVVQAQHIKGYWAENRDPTAPVIATKKSDEKKRRQAARQRQKTRQQAAGLGQGECRILFRTPNAASDPCEDKVRIGE